ncbi:D-alanyl-D-alanine carboxypeptidase family protein [Ruminococcaceae bacterium OttesenSCG-928-D13]|nr:D-alanyl-D-alanine carboxypeptidase family protein [Ruminococcaceae bacterium OttesenSCG-928-D13]
MSRTATRTLRLTNDAVYRGDLLLINPDHPLRQQPGDDALAELCPGVRLEKKAAAILARVLEAIGAGRRIVAVSGYRTMAEQQAIYADATARHGPEYARTYVALPGCSEHQSGLAIDLAESAGAIDFITPAFPYSGICQTFRRAAVRYGFIERYPKGKEAVTRIGHEPWHFRYIGLPHAALLTRLGLTLEEYTSWLRGYEHGKNPYLLEDGTHAWELGFVPAAEGGCTEIEIGAMPYTLSGNNVDGFVLAVWRA